MQKQKSALILNVIRLVFPFPHDFGGFLEVDAMQFKRVVVIKDAIAKADVFRIETVGGKIDFGDVGPFAGVKTHRTRFARGVENTSAQIEGAEVAAGVADGDDFAVRRRIVVKRNPVMAFADDFAFGVDDDAAER